MVVKSPDEFGDRMKSYERTTETRLDTSLPIIARIDGRSFSKFTQGCVKPFDDRLSNAMRATACYLVEQTHAKIGFVQSDEITLIWQNVDGGSILFDGRVLKLASVLASMAGVKFDREYDSIKMPSFDCRVWQVPSQEEAANTLLWRAMDARKNSVSSACRSKFSANQMFKKSQADMREMLASVGVDFDSAYSSEDRLGTYYRRVSGERELDEETYNAIPAYRRPPTRMIMRSWIEAVPMPFFGDIKNRVAVVFEDAKPIVMSTEEIAAKRSGLFLVK